MTWWRPRTARAFSEGRSRPSARLLATTGLAVVAIGVGALAATGALASGSGKAERSVGAGPVRVSPGIHVGRSSPSGPGSGLTPGQIREAYELPPISDLDGGDRCAALPAGARRS